MQDNIKILCTGSLNDLLIGEAKSKSIDIDVVPFIKTTAIESVEVQQEIEAVLQTSATIVFTSMNAVEAVEENRMDEQPAWNIYCIGNNTQQLVRKYFPSSEIMGTADDAAMLAELIVKGSQAEEIIFFCGDQRRNELPDILRQNGIEVIEIVVYQTIALPHKVNQDYLGIIFFSPSAVNSFFIKNKISAETVLFAIGNTTASAIKKYANNKIIIADRHWKKSLFEKMMEYFT